MHKSMLGRCGRLAALGAGVLALAGCATGYAFVQPDVAGGGGYYTSAGPYAAPGYYDDRAYSYYPGYAGFGNGGWYGSSVSFGFGLGSACGWSCGGYYGGWPWYAGGYGYPYYTWTRHGHHGHHHRDGHDGDPVVTAPGSWRNPDHPRLPPVARRGTTPPIAVPARPREDFANRRPLDSARFAPHAGFERRRAPRPIDAPMRPVTVAPRMSGFSRQAPRVAPPSRITPPRAFAPPPAPVFAPAQVAPPPARTGRTTPIKIR